MINDSAQKSFAQFGFPSIEEPVAPARHVRSIAVTSGKGGVGKTNFAVNVALELGRLGRSVTLLDADLVLANTNVLLGIKPVYHVGHLLAGRCALEDVVIDVGQGVRLIPGSNGMEEIAHLSFQQHRQFVSELEMLEDGADFMLIDTPSGMGDNVLGVLAAASEIIVVTMPEPTAIIDAYALIKTIHQHSPSKPIWVVVNSVVGPDDGQAIFLQLNNVARTFLCHRLNYLGSVIRDNSLVEAVKEQRPIVDYAPGKPASRSFRLIAKYLDKSSIVPARRTGR